MFRQMELEFVIGLLYLGCASAAKGSVVKTDGKENYSDIMKYVGNLEREMKNHIKTQERKIEMQSGEIELLKQEVADLKLMKTLPNNHQIPIQKHSKLHAKADLYKMAQTPKHRRYLFADAGDTQFGFSAYLDHSVGNLGINQTIIFNTNLFNDGGAYNNASGIYTCPVNGVYLFFFAVSSTFQHQIVAKLVVNGVNQVDAIADVENGPQYQEGHGSNMVILRLAAGTQVWVENYRWSTHFVEGDKTDRFTTFSGVLLYQ